MAHSIDLPASPLPTIEALEQDLTTLAAHLNAGNYRFLELLAEFDRRGGHVGWGIASCAHWLTWKCGIGLIAAREKVRVARALTTLPQIADAMRRGVLSYCKVRALTRIATPDNEAVLVQIGETGTVSHVEKLVRAYRTRDRDKELTESNARRADRSLRCYFDDGGMLVVEGRLDPEQGARVMKALQAASDALRQADASREASEREPDDTRHPYTARMGDALELVCETFLAQGAAPLAAGDRHLVTVHIDEAVLRDDAADGRSELADGPSLPPESVRRLCCDASLVAIVKQGDGRVLDVGRKTRAIPPALRRALVARDEGCRFPGCTNTRFVDGHHIDHWIHGGATKLDNLVLLCRRHHRFMHEYGFRIEGTGQEIRFVRPDGRVMEAVPEGERIEASAGVAAMAAIHVKRGIEIGPRTGVPRWAGERMDYCEAVAWLQGRAETGPLLDPEFRQLERQACT